MNANVLENDMEITLSKDETEAFVCLLDSSKEYSQDEILRRLSESGIENGVLPEEIQKLLEQKIIGEPYLVAKSRKPVNGKDGWYEFLFDTDIDTKPKILKDGSVDYSEYGNVPSVEEGEKIVIYHPATESRDGVNVRGETIVASKGKELARLKGKGFYLSEDDREYFAKTSGRATYKDDRLVVDNELVIDGDVSHSTGDIHYNEDIHIRGNVLAGVVITSVKGNILVDGYVEACELYAGKGVVLKNGMQGNGKGKIVAGDSVSGKFFEQLTIQSEGDVCANAIMNSYITAKRDVIVSGRFGIIIGGRISAERAISATIVGNMAEVKTELDAGVEENLFILLSQKEKEQEELQKKIHKLTEGIDQITELIANGQREDLNAKKIQLIRAKISLEKDMNEKISDKQNILDRMGRANQARISVQKIVYPGTKISINGVKTVIKEETLHTEITAKGSVLEISK